MITVTLEWVAWQNSNESSANRRLVILGAFLQIETHWICLSYIAFSIRAVKPSVHKRNKYGERGLPWQIPLEGCRLPYGFPLMRIEKDGEVTHSITQLIHLLGNPSFSIMLFRNGHSTLSYTLLMSTSVPVILSSHFSECAWHGEFHMLTKHCPWWAFLEQKHFGWGR